MDTPNTTATSHGAQFSDDSSGDEDNDDLPDSTGMLSSASSQRSEDCHSRERRGDRGLLKAIVYRFLHPIVSIGDVISRKQWSRIPDIVDNPMECYDAGADRIPSCLDPLREILFSSWLNVLIVFVPIGIAAYSAHMSPILIFVFNALAVIPLSALLTAATERVASQAGDTVGALLNISLGNLVELILFVALIHKQIRVVQASILGSIIVNSLLILGTALLATSLTDSEPVYNASETQLLRCLLSVSVFFFIMPTALEYTLDGADVAAKATLKMSRISAIMVLLIYTLYIVHELKTRRLSGPNTSNGGSDVESRPGTASNGSNFPVLSMQALSQSPRILPPRTIRFADEHEGSTIRYKAIPPIELGDMDSSGIETTAESATDDAEPRGRPIRSHELVGSTSGHHTGLHHSSSRSRLHSRSLSRDSDGLSRVSSLTGSGTRGLMRSGLAAVHLLRDGRTSVESSASQHPSFPPQRKSATDMIISVLVLIITSGLMSVCAEFLVGTIDDVTHQGPLSESVIGLIILPIVGNVAEYVTVVMVAAKNKLDLAIAVAVGSSVQIALCVTPLTLIAGWILHAKLTLTFSMFEIVTLLGTALLVGVLVSDDGGGTLRACGLKGAFMFACYIIIGLGAYLTPSPKE